jgi:hypothetical protein
MKTDLSFTSDCFETFPFPGGSPAATISTVEKAGELLEHARAERMQSTLRGLTATYNDLRDAENHEPEVENLRKMHEKLDRAVLDAYGWQDIAVPSYADVPTRAARAQRESFENDVIDRLFELNATRAAKHDPTTVE